MIRYTKQRSKYTCGPTVIINAMKWVGLDASWNKDIEFCKDICGMDKDHKGMWSWAMDEVLKVFPLFKIKKTLHMPKLKELDAQLDKNRAIVIAYLHRGGKCQSGHFMLCIGRTDKYYDVVNGTIKGKALSRISRKTMRKRLNVKRIEAGALFYPVAWSIEQGLNELKKFF